MKRSSILRGVFHPNVCDATGVFVFAAALLWWLAGQRLVWIMDEGIYLEGARRILAGQMPYRDFFALTGPGTFWNLAAFFQVFGTSLASARALLVLDLALIAACMYWLTAQFSSRLLGFWLAGFFVALVAGDKLGDPQDLVLERALEDGVQKGEPFFAFPYVPLAYFLTQGTNPTPYSFFQPGMMADADEDRALASLQSVFPSKVFYMNVPDSAILRLFPSSDPHRLRMRRIEGWLRENYDGDQQFAKSFPGYDLLIRRQQAPLLSSRLRTF